VDEYLVVSVLRVLLSIGWLGAVAYSLQDLLDSSLVLLNWTLETLSFLASAFAPQAGPAAESLHVNFRSTIQARVK